MLSLIDYIIEVADWHFGIPHDLSIHLLDFARTIEVPPQAVGDWWDHILAADAPIR